MIHIDPSAEQPPRPPRAPFVPPTVTELGKLSALTLQQSIPIGPGQDWLAAWSTIPYA